MVNIPFGIISMTFVMSVNIFIGKCRACIYSSIILKREMVLAPGLGVWTISFFVPWNFRIDRDIGILK